MEPGSNGPDRDFKNIRQFLIGIAFDFAQPEHRSHVFRQPIQRISDNETISSGGQMFSGKRSIGLFVAPPIRRLLSGNTEQVGFDTATLGIERSRPAPKMKNVSCVRSSATAELPTESCRNLRIGEPCSRYKRSNAAGSDRLSCSAIDASA